MTRKNINLIALIVISVLMLCIPSDNPQDGQQLQPVNEQHFTIGQILLPDYACADTLVVVDDDGLNKALDNYEGFEGDAACDSVFHQYCTIKH